MTVRLLFAYIIFTNSLHPDETSSNSASHLSASCLSFRFFAMCEANRLKLKSCSRREIAHTRLFAGEGLMRIMVICPALQAIQDVLLNKHTQSLAPRKVPAYCAACNRSLPNRQSSPIPVNSRIELGCRS